MPVRIANQAPEGYTVPVQAQELLDTADANGWNAVIRWSPDSENSGGLFVTVRVGRKAEFAYYDGQMVWAYQRTWHSRGCAQGKLKLFGAGSACTPDVPRSHDAPPVKKILEIVRLNPVQA